MTQSGILNTGSLPEVKINAHVMKSTRSRTLQLQKVGDNLVMIDQVVQFKFASFSAKQAV